MICAQNNDQSHSLRKIRPSPFYTALIALSLFMSSLFMPSLFMLSAAIAEPSTNKPFIAPQVIEIPAGEFIFGSTRTEKEYAYQLDEKAYGHSATRQQKWYESESPPRKIFLPAFAIMRTPVTNGQYAQFIRETKHPAPAVDQTTWRGYRLIHGFKATRPYQWPSGAPPAGRIDHPVVLVSHEDARQYAAWLSRKTGQRWRLPSEQEWEKAARGAKGAYFPWGNVFDAAKLNSHDLGPFATTPAGRFPQGASPYGLHDAAGQVFEWTATPAPNSAQNLSRSAPRFLVKGGSWDDKGCGVCRPAAKHSRPKTLKHILIGFRLLREGAMMPKGIKNNGKK